jgi:hypothetical protein
LVEGHEIQAPPPFDDLVVRDAEDVDSAQSEDLAVGRRTEQLAGASAGGMEVLDDEVTFGDGVVGLAALVRHRSSHDLACLAHALGALGRAGKWRVVVDEVACDVAVDGREVAFREELLNEAFDEVLVPGELIGGHGEQDSARPAAAAIPIRWGFPRPAVPSTLKL